MLHVGGIRDKPELNAVTTTGNEFKLNTANKTVEKTDLSACL